MYNTKSDLLFPLPTLPSLNITQAFNLLNIIIMSENVMNLEILINHNENRTFM
jgi:hypothetical protein